MSIKTTLDTVNRMQADGVIGKYAIGGAVAATFYLEPAATLDVDIFVNLPAKAAGTLLSLSPIYEYLTSRGCRVEREYIVVGDWPVQFLVPATPLELEAISQAQEIDVEGVRTWVMTAEHLIAIALQTGRAKDHARIVQFLEQGAVDQDKLNEILMHCGLFRRWEQFERTYPASSNE
jgi:hypothetical protein